MSNLRRVIVVLFAVIAIGGVIDGVFGKPPSKIVGGGSANDDEFHFIVALIYRSIGQNFCGGAIIGSRYILTAGHCVDRINAQDIAVRVGVHHLNDSNDIPIWVERIVMHPNYRRRGSQLSNDLAILVLDRDITFEGRVSKIELSDKKPKQPDNNKNYVVAGWGVTHKDSQQVVADLKKVDVKLAHAIECWDESVQEGEILCGYHETGAPCTGDSGSPMIGDGKLVGVVSSSQCEARQRNTFVNVYHFRNWINQVIG